MPVFVDSKNQDAPGGENFPLGFTESVKTGFEEAMISSPFYGGLLANQIRVANQQGTLLTQAEAKAQAAAEGFADLSIPAAGMTDRGLETMLTLARDRSEGEERLSRASGVGPFVGSLAAGLGDPVLAPLNFVPVVGASREAAILAKASIKAGVAGRILARGAIGAIEGAVGSVPSMALNAATRQAVGDDYTVDDAFMEFSQSVVLGAGMQAGIGQVSEGVSALADRSSHSWVREKFGTKSQEWRALMEHDKRTADAIAPDHAQEAEIRAREGVDPGRIEAEPVRTMEAGPAATLRQALGDRPILNEAATRSDPLAVEIVAAMRENQAAIERTPQAFEPVAAAFDALTMDRNSGFTIDEGLQFGALKRLEPHQVEIARAADALTQQPERMARMVAEYAKATERGASPAQATQEAITQIAAPKGPAEKGRLASAQTMTNAEAIADFQAKSGITLNPEKVIDADPRIDQADPSAPVSEISRASDPANRYDADELRQGRDKAKESEALPDEEDFETLADEAEAELERLRKLAEAEGARFAEGSTLPESIDIDGVQRSTKDSTGRRLGRTEEEVRNFWAWFGDSKVVDADGKPLVVYHGTASDFSEFQRSKASDKEGRRIGAGWGKGKFYFTESPDAAGVSADWAAQSKERPGSRPSITPVYLAVKNPISAEDFASSISERASSGASRDAAISAVDSSIKRKGVDGIIDRDSGGIAVFDPTKIKSATGNRGTFDPANPDIRMAEGAADAGIQIQEASDAIEARFGAGVLESARKAGFEIISSKDLPAEAQRASVVGVTVGKKSYLAADRLSKDDAAAFFLHEYGVHVGMEGMLGREGFADIQARVGDLLNRDSDLRAVVDSLIPATTKPGLVAEERLAYLVQHMEGVLAGREEWPTGAAWLRIADPATRRAIVELVREIVAKVKAYLYAEFPSLRGMDLSAEDVHAITVRALQHGSEMERRTAFAEAGGEVDEIAAAKQLSKRVREVYKKAYDKIAVSPELSDEALAAAAESAGLEKAEAVELVKRFRKLGNAEAALKADMSSAALVRYRATLNAIKLHEGMAQIMRFKGSETEGALSLDAGSEWNIEGARARNVDSARGKWEKELCGGAEWELVQAKLFDLASAPDQAPHIVNALYDLQMDRKDGLGTKYNADHAKIAEILNRYQESSLKQLRRMGVDIGQIKGRMLHQEHDTWALRNFANGGRTGATRSALRGLIGRVLPSKWVPIGSDAHMNAWIDFVAPLLDGETYDGRTVDRAYLEGSYKLLAGFKEPSKERELLSGRYSTGGVPGEAARLSSLGRNMKFKGPEEWIAYQKRCGNPDLLANFFGEQQATARSLGIMEIYGPGGENTRATLHQAIGQQLVGKPAMDWQNSRKKRESQWAVVSGKTNIPGNEILANTFANARALTTAATLGGSVLSQAPDVANIAKWRALRFNRNAGGLYTESAAHLQDFARAASGSPKIRAVLEAFRADMDATVGGLLRKVENGDSRGFTANLVEKVYKYQGATWLNRNNKHASVLGLSNWLASEARHGFDAIEPTTRDMLLQHNVTGPEWDLVRLAEQIADDGRSYLTPEGLRAVSEEKIAAHLESTGRKATPKLIEQWRDDMRIKLIGMMSDEVSKSVLEPTARQRLTTTGGLSAGTWSGELVRSMWACKSFAVSQFQRGWMSEFRGRSDDPRARIRAGSGSHYVAIANYIGALTALGYVSYMLKGWAAGVQRKGILDKEDEDDKVLPFDIPVVDDRVLFAAMNQGGGLGIYGDFLFADADRYGGGFMQTLSGPLLGKVEDAYKLWNAAKSADPEDAGKLANQAVRMLKGATPFGNLWWSRHIMDRLLWWNLQEAINPAGLQRLEAAAEKRGDTYIFTKPTAALN